MSITAAPCYRNVKSTLSVKVKQMKAPRNLCQGCHRANQAFVFGYI